VVSGGGGDVEDTAEAEDGDGEVAQAGHDAGTVGGADLGTVFVVGDIAPSAGGPRSASALSGRQPVHCGCGVHGRSLQVVDRG